jgi:hypothetical protein
VLYTYMEGAQKAIGRLRTRFVGAGAPHRAPAA